MSISGIPASSVGAGVSPASDQRYSYHLPLIGPAMTEFLTSVRARHTRSDFPLRQRLYAAGMQIVRGTPAYNEAVSRADRNSWPR
jgi:hypothetical protein